MIKTISECQGCAECIGCGRKWQKYKILVCDCCGRECDSAYIVNGEHMCEDCALDSLDVITERDLNESNN